MGSAVKIIEENSLQVFPDGYSLTYASTGTGPCRYPVW